MQHDLSGGNILVTVGGWLVAVLVAAFTFIAQWRKGGVEETAVVLGKWKELVEAHERQLSGLSARIAELTTRVLELETLADAREDRIHELERQLEGEKRNMEQQARSFAEQLRRLGHNGPFEWDRKDNGPNGGGK